MTKLKNKIWAFVIIAAMLVGVFQITTFDSDVSALSTNVTVPFSSSISFTTSDGTSHTSTTYRIPAMVTLSDGTMVAAADARYNTNYDGGGLDTLVAYSSNGGEKWEYTAANYLPDNGDSYNAKSTAFIDPSLVVAQDSDRVYMLTGLYPGGIALNGSGNTAPSAEVAFDDNGYLKLSKGSSTSYDYYLNDGKIYDYSTNTDQGYTVDGYFYVYKNGVKLGNLFYSETSYSVAAASVASSDDTAIQSDETQVVDGDMTEAVYSDTSSSGTDTQSSEAAVSGIDTENTEETSLEANENTGDQVLEANSESSDTGATDAVASDITSDTESTDSTLTDDAVQPENSDDTDTQLETAASDNDAFKVVPTAYLYLTYSDDGGKTWSEPSLLNLKTSSENACLVGPGAGLTTSDGMMIFPIYSYSGSTNSQRTGFVYSTDGGATWQRSSDCGVSWSSEASAVEITETSTIRFFYRNSNSTLCYIDYDRDTSSWGSSVNTGTAINSNTKLSAITYSKTADDGKQIILISAPTGSTRDAGSNNNNEAYRKNGTVFVEEVDTDGTMTLKNKVEINSSYFVYSCLAERSDGSIALLYENTWSGWGVNGTCGMDLTVLSATDIVGDSFSFDSSTTQYVSLETGDCSSEYTVTDVSISEGWHLTGDRKAAYKIEKKGPDTLDSISSGDSFKISSSGYWLKLSGTTLGVTADYTQATVWTASTSSSDSSSFYLKSGSYYLNHYNNTLSVRASASAKNTNWYYSSDNGFYYTTWSSGGSYATPYRYLSFGGTSWEYTTSPSDYAVARNSTDTDKTTAKFVALDVTTTTTVSLGRTDFVLPITGKNAEVKRSITPSTTTELDAVDDLGLVSPFANRSTESELQNLVPTYTVSYEITYSTDDNIFLTESELAPEQITTVGANGYGNAEVTATVTNSNSGNVVGTVIYDITVEENEITDVKNVYVPVDGTATIEGLEGTITGTRDDGSILLDTTIATVEPEAGTELDDGSITITGVSVGATEVIVGNVAFNIYVVNKNEQKTSSKYLYLYVDEMDNTTVYYTINGSTTQKVDGTGVLIDQTFNGGFHIMFFAAPDEGYALSTMSMKYNETDPDGTMTETTDFYTISNGTREDGSDSDAWPFTDPDADTIPSSGSDSAWKTINGSKHGFRWSLIEGNITIEEMRSIFTLALEFGADGATNMTKNGTAGGYFHWTFASEKLPTLNKKIVSYERDGKTYDYTAGETLEFGDILTYQFDVISFSDNVNYTGITLSDDQIGWSRTIDDNTLDTPGVYSYTAKYTVTRDDVEKYPGGRFVNTASIDYTYSSMFSAGAAELHAEASISVTIAGIVSYTWPEGIPDEIKNDTTNYPLPNYKIVASGDEFEVEPYTGKTTYDVVEDGIKKGTWEYKGWWDHKDEQYKGGEKVVMPELESVEFVGHWEYEPAEQYTVSYKLTDDSASPPDVYPPDSCDYYENETYTIDNFYNEGDTIETEAYTYTFSGWMLDGTVVTGDQTMGTEDVTYVGKWTRTSNTTSLTLTKQGADAVDKNQTFVFEITGGDPDDPVDFKVSVQGNSSVTIDGFLKGMTYTIKEISGWSWRYDASSWTYTTSTEDRGSTGTGETAEIVMGESDNRITYTNSRKTENKWLDSNSSCRNIFD